MVRLQSYRFVAAILGCLFCVFSVGVPIVLASCPMMGQGGQSLSSSLVSCCPEPFDRTEPVLTAYKNTSCCETVIAAARNTEEFVQANAEFARDAAMSCTPATALPVASLLGDARVRSLHLIDSSPPAHRVGLPVLYASLLI